MLSLLVGILVLGELSSLVRNKDTGKGFRDKGYKGDSIGEKGVKTSLEESRSVGQRDAQSVEWYPRRTLK